MPIKEGSNKKPFSFLKKIKDNLTGIVLGTAIGLSAVYALKPNYAEAKEPGCVPHYLAGLRQPKDKLENMLEKERVYNTLLTKYPYGTHGIRILNGSLESDAKIHGVLVRLIFPNYVLEGNKVKHYNATGINTYTKDEFQCIVADNINYITESATLAMKDYQKTFDTIIDAQEEALKKAGVLKSGDRLRKMLDKKIPGYNDLKLRDVLFTPDIKIQDFVPDRYYFGEIPALGVTYINTGIIGIDPKARILDHINGWPTIMVHEMTHKNKKLQSMPMLNSFDAELWASFPMLVHEDLIHMLYHPYLKDVRKISKILFNFDSQKAYEDIVSLETVMGVELEREKNYKKLRDYVDKVTKISKAIRDTAFKEYIPEFYTHPLYYTTLNEFLGDSNATFKLIMYKTFEPTMLGGPEKTKEFVEENSEVTRDISRKVMQELKKRRDSGETIILPSETKAKIKDELRKRLNDMNEADRHMLIELAKKFGMPTTGSIDDLIEFGIKMHRLGVANFEIPTEGELILE